MEGLLLADGHVEAGGAALLMHNERLADPLDEFTRALSVLTSKRNKTDVEHLAIARLEFLGCLYTTPIIADPDSLDGQVVTLPAWNVISCLQDGAKRRKRGKDVLRGVFPRVEFVEFSFDDPASGSAAGLVGPEALWKHGGYSLRKGIGVQGKKTMRTRPVFSGWTFSLPIEVDANIFDRHALEACWADAGRYSGIGDRRPVFGRFRGAIEWTGA